MINDLKLGFGVLKYAYGKKGTIAGCVCMAVFSIATWLLGFLLGESVFPSGYFLMLIGMFVIQLYFSVNISNMVQASPARKRMHTSVPAVMGTVITLAAYVPTILIEVSMAAVNPEWLQGACVNILRSVVLMVCIMLYYSICYKHMIAGTIMFFIVFFMSYSFMMADGWSEWTAGFGWGEFTVITLAGAVLILVCGVLSYLISLAFYKAPISKSAMTATLRRQI